MYFAAVLVVDSVVYMLVLHACMLRNMQCNMLHTTQLVYN